MNQKQIPGYVMVGITCSGIVIAFVVAFSAGDNPRNQDILTAVAIVTAAQMMVTGYFLMFLWDRLNMLSDLYTILTGESQEELAGTLQRLHNTIRQGASNVKWRLDSASSRLDQGEPDV